MQVRKDPLVVDCYYHVFSRSIAKFIIFNNSDEYFRMVEILNLYRFADFNYRYSRYEQMQPDNKEDVINSLEKNNQVLVEILAYCLMPTHIHLLLKQKMENGISKYLGKVLNSYSRYFNTRHHRTGPLWSGRFKSVLVSSDEQLLHLTRYVHLNPTSAELVSDPLDWVYSSYLDYISMSKGMIGISNDLVDMTPTNYKKFVLDRKDYQRELSRIKNLMIDNYTG